MEVLKQRRQGAGGQCGGVVLCLGAGFKQLVDGQSLFGVAGRLPSGRRPTGHVLYGRSLVALFVEPVAHPWCQPVRVDPCPFHRVLQPACDAIWDAGNLLSAGRPPDPSAKDASA